MTVPQLLAQVKARAIAAASSTGTTGGRPTPVRTQPVASSPSVSGATGTGTATTNTMRGFTIPQTAPDTNPNTQMGIPGDTSSTTTSPQTPLTATQSGGGTISTGAPSGSSGTDNNSDNGLVTSLMGLVASMYAGAGVSGAPSDGEVLGPLNSTTTTSSGSSSKAGLVLVLLLIGVGFYYWHKHHKKGAA